MSSGVEPDRPVMVGFRLEPDLKAQAVAAAASREAAPWAVVVGGYVRARLLGTPSADLDLVVPDSGARIAARIADAVGGKVLPLSRWRQWTVFGHAFRVDVTEADDVEADLARRDFTINAIAWWLTPDPGAIHDPMGGMDDLAAGRLATCSPSALAADPARVIRGARLIAAGWVPSRATLRSAAEAASSLPEVPVDRVRHEWRRLACGWDPPAGLTFLESCGALRSWLGVETGTVEDVGAGRGRWGGRSARGRPAHDASESERAVQLAVAALGASPLDRAEWVAAALRMGLDRREAVAAWGIRRRG